MSLCEHAWRPPWASSEPGRGVRSDAFTDWNLADRDGSGDKDCLARSRVSPPTRSRILWRLSQRQSRSVRKPSGGRGRPGTPISRTFAKVLLSPLRRSHDSDKRRAITHAPRMSDNNKTTLFSVRITPKLAADLKQVADQEADSSALWRGAVLTKGLARELVTAASQR